MSISWKVLFCSVDKTSGDLFWDARIPARCEPFDGVLDVYLNEYVRVLSPAMLPGSAHPVHYLPINSSVSKPTFSSGPRAELISKRLG